ncbi:MAG: flagellar basal body rod protein FlgC [Bdellovibrionales bacterium]
MSSVFSSALSGLNAAIARVANSATNIANASSRGTLPETTGESSTAFEPRDVVNLTTNTGEVRTTTVARTPSYNPMYAPSDPDANEDGLVAEPNVDLASEMTDLLLAEIAYKANARVIKAEQERQKTTLDTLT